MRQALLWVHLLAAAFWLGGLLSLGLVVFAARRLEPEAFRALIRSVGRAFAIGAAAAWALLGATGLVLAAGEWSPTLVAKTVLAGVAVVSAAAHVLSGRSRERGLLMVSRSMAAVTLASTLGVFWLATRLS